MSRATRARRIARTAAFGGGSAGLVTAAFYGVIRGEARLARHRVTANLAVAAIGAGDGIWGSFDGPPLTMLMLGDSTAVGLGVDSVTETPGVLVAGALAELAERPVRLVVLAISGATSERLPEQVARALGENADVAVVMVGANDVTARLRPEVSVRHLGETVRRLVDGGTEVVVGTCPDLGVIRPMMQPLRSLGRRWSRELAAAQTIAVVEAGGRTVSLGSLLGPEFARRPEMFSPDQFHPSAQGYAAAAAVMLPSVADAVGVWPGGVQPRPGLGLGAGIGIGREVRPVALAAARAAGVSGTEVSAATLHGRAVGPRGRWARVLRRRPATLPTPTRGEA